MEIRLTDADIHAALAHKFGTEDFTVQNWKMLSLMENERLGFLGDHFKVEATYRRGSQTQNTSLFVKGLPVNKEARATVVKCGAFKKESLFYKLLATDIGEAVKMDRGPEFQPAPFPYCHLVKDDCMLLDDLAPFGFAGIDGRQSMPIEHTRLVVRALAEMHAGSLVLEEHRGKTLLEQFPEFDFETFFSEDPNHVNTTWHQASINLCVAITAHLDKYKNNPATVAKIQAALPSLLRTVLLQMHPWPGVRNALCHGDVWTNNFMFRKNAQGRVVEASLVDFQLARYMPPAHDLVMMVTFCTEKATWDKHWAELQKLHWETMADALRRAGCDPDKVLPWSEFQKVAEETWKFGLMQQAMEYPFSLAPASLMGPLLVDPDKFHHHCHVDRTPAITKLYHEDAIFHQRFTEIMEALIDGYILNQH